MEDAGGDAAEPMLVMVDRSAYSDVGLTDDLDYEGDLGVWACHPMLENNECHTNLDATVVTADGLGEVVAHERAEDPSFDCFYVYPTVLNDGTPNLVDFSEEGLKLVRDALFSQGARFNRLCEVWAPLYRQAGLDGTTYAADADLEIGLADVRAAFATYLEQSGDRKFVLVGHSQGAFVLTDLIQQDVDGVDAVQDRMLSAILLGARVQAPPGERMGGTFQTIPTCQEAGETGCVIAYASYHAEMPPGTTARFGIHGEDGDGVCTDPIRLAGRTNGLLSGGYYPRSLNNAAFRGDWDPPSGLTTPFLLYQDVLKAECARTDTAGYLELSSDLADDDPGTPPYRSTIEAIGWGLHLTDFNNAMDDLIEAVRLQAESEGL